MFELKDREDLQGNSHLFIDDYACQLWSMNLADRLVVAARCGGYQGLMVSEMDEVSENYYYYTILSENWLPDWLDYWVFLGFIGGLDLFPRFSIDSSASCSKRNSWLVRIDLWRKTLCLGEKKDFIIKCVKFCRKKKISLLMEVQHVEKDEFIWDSQGYYCCYSLMKIAKQVS